MARSRVPLQLPGVERFQVRETVEFAVWLEALRDTAGQAVIARRIDRMRRGNFGNCEPVGDGVSELKIDFGPGYRVYFIERRGTLIILLCGGDKDSQRRDIKRAHRLAKEV